MQENRLYLIFEFLTMDLKKYLDTAIPENEMMDKQLVKSYTYQLLQVRNNPRPLYLARACA